MTELAATAALRQLVAELPSRVQPERIDQAWLFLPREVNARESGLVVLSLFVPEDGADQQRLLLTVRYEAVPQRNGTIQLSYDTVEQGRAPAERIPRLIQGVLARLRDETEHEPLEEQVAGDPARWAALVARLGGAG